MDLYISRKIKNMWLVECSNINYVFRNEVDQVYLSRVSTEGPIGIYSQKTDNLKVSEHIGLKYIMGASLKVQRYIKRRYTVSCHWAKVL